MTDQLPDWISNWVQHTNGHASYHVNGDAVMLRHSRFHGLMVTASRVYADQGAKRTEVTVYAGDVDPILAWLLKTHDWADDPEDCGVCMALGDDTCPAHGSVAESREPATDAATR